MTFVHSCVRLIAALCLAGCVYLPAIAGAADVSATIGGTVYVNHGLVGVGRIPANQRDKFGDTFGSGSGLAIDLKSWAKNGDGYKGSLWLLPDRGYNAVGTVDYQARVNTIDFTLTPVAPGAAVPADKQQAEVAAKLADTLMLVDAKGAPTTGLDPVRVRAAADGLPTLPEGPNARLPLDDEAIVRLADGSMLISDEYGPNIYHFGADGKLISATQPPQALVPMRKGQPNFSSSNPGTGETAPDPKDPETGRQNNQGLEGMSLAPDGKTLIAVLQSATRQDGGDSPATRDHTRALVFDATDVDHLKLVHEYVVPLPKFQDAKGKTAVAAQSEMFALSPTRFLMLPRDSGNGQSLKGSTSLYRKVVIVDTTGATDIAGTDFDGLKPVAPKGQLDASVTPAKLTEFIDINDNAELNRFGLHNGEPNDKNDLYEKWEAMGLAPALDAAAPDDYFLFIADDNDFIAQDGFQEGAPYKADGGGDVDTMFLVYRVTLPGFGK